MDFEDVTDTFRCCQFCIFVILIENSKFSLILIFLR